MTIQMIPLNQLHPSSANVRKTGASLGIDELAASITTHGLLQNLQVRPLRKSAFEVVAGGRRLAALKLLVKRKALDKTFLVPCHVLEDEDDREISLAENAVRLSMHPADQFEAFQGLAEAGQGVEEIAARFGVTAAVVRQRLRLASVSPRLIAVYREDGMSLDQLMAFTVSDDHAAQDAAWFDQPDYRHGPADIRACLTAAQVQASDRRVQLVGLGAYLEAGGGLNRDLFQSDHDGYLTDPALLDRLVAQRLEEEAHHLRAEGWRWVEIMPRRNYGALHGFGRVYPEPQPLADDDQERRDTLAARVEALLDEHGDEPEPDILAKMDTLSDEIAAINARAAAWREQDLAIAGALVTIGHNGVVEIERGLVRAEDKPLLRQLSQSDDIEGASADGVLDASPSLSSALVKALTAERTAALRATLLGHEAVGLAALTHALALPLFYGPYCGAASCLDLSWASRDLTRDTETVEQSSALAVVDLREAAWRQRLPEQAADLFDWLLRQDSATLISLACFCAAVSVDAVRSKQGGDPGRLRHADQLATAAGLDMTLWWKPTKDRYLGRVSKALILEAVREAGSPQAAENLAGLKKDQLVARAEQKLGGSGWLPPLLRKAEPAEPDRALEVMAAE